ncbi:MAG: adenosylhomocysteinase [Clostridiales bacterium]|nr:adenosylhomocysteinase [Clostridiales bacterium]
MMYRVNDISIAGAGEKKIEWARRNMPLLRGIETDFIRTKPFAGLKIALSVHIEAKTACLCRLLTAGGAELYATGCNPLSTQDDVAAALAAGGISVFARHGVDEREYLRDLESVLRPGPNIVIDDGGDLAGMLHQKMPELIDGILGGCEETTTGITRLRSMERDGILRYPVIMVNNARCKYLFDNRYGTGQSVWDGINRTTNLVVAGKNVVIAGYGWCGKGVAMRAKGLGANVVVTEVDPVKALEAVMDGFRVMPMEKAAEIGDLFITVTGCKNVICESAFKKMKNGAILSNAGHFNVEVDVDALEEIAVRKEEQRPNIMGYLLDNGNWIYLLAEGRLVNLASGDGHPVEIMDMSFAIQALSAESLAKKTGRLTPKLYPVPEEIDLDVARRKLDILGAEIDTLSDEQKHYLDNWLL